MSKDLTPSQPIEGTELLSSDCRSTHCRIEVEHESQAKGQDFALTWNDIPGSKLVQEMDVDNGKPRTLAYLIKAGEEENSPVFAELFPK